MNIPGHKQQWFIGWRPIDQARAMPEFYSEGFESYEEARVIARGMLSKPSGTHYFITTTIEARFEGGKWDNTVNILPPNITLIDVKDVDGAPYEKGMMKLQEKHNVKFAEQGVPDFLEEEVSSLLEVCSVLVGQYERMGWDEEKQQFIFTYRDLRNENHI